MVSIPMQGVLRIQRNSYETMLLYRFYYYPLSLCFNPLDGVSQNCTTRTICTYIFSSIVKFVLPQGQHRIWVETCHHGIRSFLVTIIARYYCHRNI